MKNMPLQVSIVITTKNRVRDLERTCRVLRQLSPPPLEILVTADGCTDGTVEFVKSELPQARLFVNQPSRGSIAARDRIMALSITSNMGSTAAPAASRDAIGPLLAEAQIDAGKRNRLPLAGRSACHSLWIIAADPQRDWYSLTVSEETGKGQPILHSVVW